MKRIGAMIVGLLCLGVYVVHAEDGDKDLSMDSFKGSVGPSAGTPRKPVEFVTLPGGKFTMGTDNGDSDAKPTHEVTIATFDMSKTLVTVEQYAECVTKGACKTPDKGVFCNWGLTDRQRHPINCVSWKDADDFAKFAGARLPSEAEWEYAAKSGGQDQKYPWGNEAPTCDKVVMGGCDNNGTMPVCSRSAGNTKQGLCDMAGNVWQWVQDKYQDSYDKAPRDGSAFEAAGSLRGARGGCFVGADPEYLRTDHRGDCAPARRGGRFGFRLARSRR